MTCEEVKALLDCYADGELDLVNHVQIEQHVNECSDCEQRYQNLLALKSAMTDDSLRFRASGDLRDKIRASLKSDDPKPKRERWWEWRWIPVLATAAVLTAILITTITVFRPTTSSEDVIATEIASDHVRSMMVSSHLTDVISTDQHTVKPWFEGKLDFSPPVVDLGSQGFTLVGGRLDYAGGRAVAALVYQRRQHVINLFVYPAANDATVANKALVRQGFNLVQWSRSGMTFWAVSDLNLAELQEFAADLQN